MTTQAKDLMANKILTIKTGETARAAVDLMREKRIRHLVVEGEDGTVRGIVSQTDVAFLAKLLELKVENIMTPSIEHVQEDTPLRSAIFHMLEKGISSLLVLDETGEATGIMTSSDVLWHLSHLLKDEPEERKSVFERMNLSTVGQFIQRLSDVGL